MPFHMDTTAPENAPQVFSQSGGPLGKSLFVPVYQQDLNTDEREVAVYLDAEQALSWWHRNVARSQYGIQGWQGRRIYPDFVFAVGSDGMPERITVLETKGDHLDNIDTGYKRELMDFLSRQPVATKLGSTRRVGPDFERVPDLPIRACADAGLEDGASEAAFGGWG